MVQHGLTASQERDLVVAAECGDLAARRRLVEAFLPAIVSVARGFQGSPLESRELVQEGVAGLLFAARRYDVGLSTPFWGYASFWVRKAMQELIAELGRPVALSDRAVRELAQIRHARREQLGTDGTQPTTDELSRATGMSRAHVDRLLAAEGGARSMEELLWPEEGSGTTIADTVADPAAEQAYQQVLDDIELAEVRRLTDVLDDRERMVIRAHYGLGEEVRTLSEIGARLGLTAERARQIEVGALDKLRASLAQPAPVREVTT